MKNEIKPYTTKDIKRNDTNNDMGFLGLSKKEEKSLKNGVGLGFVAIGLYYLLVYFGIITTFTSTIEILNKRENIFIVGIILVVVGVILNEKIRNIFRE